MWVGLVKEIIVPASEINAATLQVGKGSGFCFSGTRDVAAAHLHGRPFPIFLRGFLLSLFPNIERATEAVILHLNVNGWGEEASPINFTFFHHSRIQLIAFSPWLLRPPRSAATLRMIRTLLLSFAHLLLHPGSWPHTLPFLP